MKENGKEIALSKIPVAMVLPVIGMAIGLIIAIVFTYRKPRDYKDIETEFSGEEALAAEQELKWGWQHTRSEEHTSELQSRFDLVCRLLLEKTKEYNS